MERAVDDLGKLNCEFLLDIDSSTLFEEQPDAEGFLWLLWGALLEVMVRMDYRDDSHESIVLLVMGMMSDKSEGFDTHEVSMPSSRPPSRHYMCYLLNACEQQFGERQTENSALEFRRIWHSASLGFGRKSRPLPFD